MRDTVLRYVLVILIEIIILGLGGKKQAIAQMGSQIDHMVTIVAVGDSLTAGLGVAEGEAYPAQLESRLRASGYRYKVINAGVSGETSHGTLSRVKWVLTLRPDIVVLETGANDGFRGIDPREIEKNLDTAVAILNDHGVTVIMAGMRMFQSLGYEYADRFAAIYPSVSARRQVKLIPFFLEDVAGDPRLNQADGIHPNEKGYSVIAENVYPYVVDAIKEREAKSKQRLDERSELITRQ